MRATEVFLIVMIGKGLDREQNIFGNGQVVVSSDLSDEYRVGWAIEPRGFGLDPVNVGQLLEIFACYVIIPCDDLRDFLPQP